MNEELSYLDAELKGLFVEEKYDEIEERLKDRPDGDIKEIYSYNWNVVKKYYDAENFELLFKHIKFVAYSCFMAEYANVRGLVSQDAFTSVTDTITKILNKKA